MSRKPDPAKDDNARRIVMEALPEILYGLLAQDWRQIRMAARDIVVVSGHAERGRRVQ